MPIQCSRTLHFIRLGSNNFKKFAQFGARKMSAALDKELHNNAREIFIKSVEEVSSRSLIRNTLSIENEILYINDIECHLKENLYMVGFGKAVIGMACEVVKLTQGHLQKGILSVPVNSAKLLSEEENNLMNSMDIEIIEGARDNLPDTDALKAASKIERLVSDLNENHTLLVLISGGGSALLPLPKPPITLEEKIDIIKKLSTSGANITELNTVRKKISVLKGGGLARLAAPAKTISLIVSDVIGNPIGFIASGPTFENKDETNAALQIVQKYGLFDTLPTHVQEVLSCEDECSSAIAPKPENVIIGDNGTALLAASSAAKQLKYFPIIVSDSIEGDVIQVAEFYQQLLNSFYKYLHDKISASELICKLRSECSACITKRYSLWVNENDVSMGKLALKGINTGVCFITGGEPTVKVSGTGAGGRNQELALRMSQIVQQICADYPKKQVCFLSAGTDGIDGPTNAAGAVVNETFTQTVFNDHLSIDDSLNNNDSHNLFLKVDGGKNLIFTGHTGTNVMDVHLILIKNKK